MPLPVLKKVQKVDTRKDSAAILIFTEPHRAIAYGCTKRFEDVEQKTLAFVRKEETLLASLKLLFWWKPKPIAA